MNALWLVGAGAVLWLVAWQRHRAIKREAQRSAEIRRRMSMHPGFATETLWPGSNAARFDGSSPCDFGGRRCPIGHVCNTPGGPVCYRRIEEGIAQLEELANG